MDTRTAYNNWASQYDTNENRTRDLEGMALRQMLGSVAPGRCLEIGCGTGKNSVWLAERAKELRSVDLSEEMLTKAREKQGTENVRWILADITRPWTFRDGLYDTVTFSLVLEHIQDLDPVLNEAARSLHAGGLVYIGELHPFKQYSGTKARFENDKGLQVVDCYMHHVSDFIRAGKKCGLHLVDLEEFFDEDARSGIPRILTLILKKI